MLGKGKEELREREIEIGNQMRDKEETRAVSVSIKDNAVNRLNMSICFIVIDI